MRLPNPSHLTAQSLPVVSFSGLSLDRGFTCCQGFTLGGDDLSKVMEGKMEKEVLRWRLEESLKAQTELRARFSRFIAWS